MTGVAFTRPLPIEIGPRAPDGFCHWLAGFVDGEGCFSIQFAQSGRGAQCRLQINLRADDIAILKKIKAQIGVGWVYKIRATAEERNPRVAWHVFKINELVNVIIPLFDKYPLRAKKAKDYEIWKRAVYLIYSGRHLSHGGYCELVELNAELLACRPFRDA